MYNNMNLEMRACFVGPMPVEEFLERFLPVPPSSMPKDKPSGFETMAGVETESKMYDGFVSLFSTIVRIQHL